MPQVYDPAGASQDLVSPADEAEVRGHIFGFLQLLNRVSSQCGLGLEYVGSGSNRNFCFTDLLLRRGNTDVTQLSAANWAVIEVKGPWQLILPEDVSLGDALHHSGYRKAVLRAVQQAYGDAVAEEAPIFAITNYDVTVFCHRNFCNAADKRIWASPPIPWNCMALPPRAAWLHFMAVGQQCHDAQVKSNLSHDSVPCTPSSGYPLPLDAAHTLQLNAAWQTGYQTKAIREQPSRAAKRQKAQAIALQEDCGPGLQPHSTNAAMDTGTDHTATTDTLAAWTSQLPPKHEEVDVAQLPWLPAHKIKLTMECIASTSSVRVMKAYQGKELLAMKVFDDSKAEAITSLINELKAYHALHDLQGATIPMLHSFGRMAHTGCPAIVTHWAGRTLRADQLSPQLRDTVQEGLRAMHACHVSHGDVRLDNILWKQGKVLFCDFGRSNINATSVKLQQDFHMLDALYN